MLSEQRLELVHGRCVGEVHEVPVKSKCWLGWKNPEVRLFWAWQEWEVESDGSSKGKGRRARGSGPVCAKDGFKGCPEKDLGTQEGQTEMGERKGMGPKPQVTHPYCTKERKLIQSWEMDKGGRVGGREGKRERDLVKVQVSR